MSDHTSPWRTIGQVGHGFAIVDKDNYTVADVYLEECVPLVTAAPDLLAACKALLAADGENGYSAAGVYEARQMMVKAIAKAEGRENPASAECGTFPAERGGE